MKSLTFNKNSLHYALAKLGGFDDFHHTTYDGATDICFYTRRVIFGVFVAIIVSLAFATISNLAIHTILGVAFSLIYQSDMFSEWGQVGAMLIVFGCIISFLWIMPGKIYDWYCSFRNSLPEKPVAPDGFIKSAYKSHKEKYCVGVKFE